MLQYEQSHLNYDTLCLTPLLPLPKKKTMEKNLKQWVLQSIGNVHETSKGSQLAEKLFEQMDTD